MKSGKYTLGYKTVLKTLRSGKGAWRRAPLAPCAAAARAAAAALVAPGGGLAQPQDLDASCAAPSERAAAGPAAPGPSLARRR
jgi:hypothetical protein